ncbi:MAG: 50S ribosomal protein L30 [Candidatus Melainabacteria bacterium RIFOXYA12_FULL_32_12]|nr:MAG: 50S ribosomal protein L30 [Candidatus Melainabacteria bacterium RIFOXYA2_FULL_32_9]OGI24186.1 MAG: 50S ribosomal protein L30 [Candidatus Melainabacteria bacterium RIFOXYA12_FULL_32_12]
MSNAKQIKVTLKKSIIGASETQKKIVKALGISKMNQTVTHNDTPAIRGMVNKIPHLVNVEE